MKEPKYTINERIRVSDMGNGWNGSVGKVIDPRWDYTPSADRWTVRVQLDNEDGPRSFYENSLAPENPELAPISVTRQQLKTWLAVMQAVDNASDDPFNNDAEDAIKELDELVNPPAKRTYTVVVSGKVNDIESALSNLEASEEALSDKVTVEIVLSREEKINKDGNS